MIAAPWHNSQHFTFANMVSRRNAFGCFVEGAPNILPHGGGRSVLVVGGRECIRDPGQPYQMRKA
jgi:hypothetical protein